jgi:hypothetical protein
MPASENLHKSLTLALTATSTLCQVIESGLGLLQVQCAEALGKPAVNRSEKLPCLIPLPLIAPQPRHAHRRAQLSLRRLASGLHERTVKYGRRRVAACDDFTFGRVIPLSSLPPFDVPTWDVQLIEQVRMVLCPAMEPKGAVRILVGVVFYRLQSR